MKKLGTFWSPGLKELYGESRGHMSTASWNIVLMDSCTLYRGGETHSTKTVHGKLLFYNRMGSNQLLSLFSNRFYMFLLCLVFCLHKCYGFQSLELFCWGWVRWRGGRRETWDFAGCGMTDARCLAPDVCDVCCCSQWKNERVSFDIKHADVWHGVGFWALSSDIFW